MAATPPGSLAVSGEYDLARRAESRKEQFDAAREHGWRAQTQPRRKPRLSATLQFDNYVVRW
jgi:hypothetical protein